MFPVDGPKTAMRNCALHNTVLYFSFSHRKTAMPNLFFIKKTGRNMYRTMPLVSSLILVLQASQMQTQIFDLQHKHN